MGSTSLAGHPAAYKIIEEVLDEFQPEEVVSGGADGIDKMAIECAKRRGIQPKEYLPVCQEWHRGFKPRNLRIAMRCNGLIRIVAYDSTTYGSGWTRDRAAEMGKPTREYVIGPST